jgi:hypothetical protein
MISLRLLPRSQHVEASGTVWALPLHPTLRFSTDAGNLPALVAEEWARETGHPLQTVSAPELAPFSFTLETPAAPASPLPVHPEAYALEITPEGVAASAQAYPGLVHAWQTFKQIIRQFPRELPGLRIADRPTLDWRVYHLDLKGTRRSLASLYALLPLLAEFKINAVLVEYEDYLRLDRHPDIAIPEALSPDQVRAWVARAADYGIAVIPLIQTLGHLQYVLRKPAYRHLEEYPGDPSEACSSHPDSWPLIRDFLDEIIDLHPQAPFIHCGLDETFLVGTCPRCQLARGERPPIALYVDWLNRVTRHVSARGLRPMAWGSMIGPHLLTPLAQSLNREVTFIVNGGYEVSGPTTQRLDTFARGSLSRQWLERPEGEINALPPLHFRGGRCIEDLSEAELSLVRELSNTPGFPREVRSHTGLALFARQGFQTGVVSGIRVSAHGCIIPKFITSQLNTLTGAEACRRHPNAPILIGSSWSRGHSLTSPNAHPDLDAYGIATLGDAGWSPLGRYELRDFDARFAFQFLGLPDESLGNLLFLFERTSAKADHVMSDYLPQIRAGCAALLPLVQRHREFIELLAQMVEIQALRFKAQFALLEMEYLYPVWNRVPPAFAERIAADVRTAEQDLLSLAPHLHALYAQTLIPADAAELVATQLDFLRDTLRLVADRVCKPTPRK